MADEPKDEGATDDTPAEGEMAEGDTQKEGGYQFDDDLSPPESKPAKTATGKQGGGFAEELFSKTIHAKFRTFYVDLKESVNGKFVKVSEKSRGRKSTIMMDAEDVPAMIEALQEVQKQL